MDVVLASLVIRIAWLDLLVFQNLLKMPNIVFPGFVALDEVNDVIVGNNLVILVVDAASEFLDFGKIVHSLFVIVDHFDNLGSVSGTIFLRRHQECAFDQFFGR